MINKIKGRQGSWFADTPIGELPVLKGECWQTNGYRDPHRYNTDSARDRKYVEAVKAGIVVIARYQEMPEGAPRRVGYLGRNGGGFNALHMVATDSSGNLYTGEVDPNNRVQRFLVGR